VTKKTSHEITNLKTLIPGRVTSNVTGGCLSIIQASLKTPYEVKTDGKILFIEDVSEPLYKIDRMLTHIKAAGKLNQIKGVIAGAFAKSNFSADRFNALLIDIFGEYNIPIVTDFPAGHGSKKFIVPFNKKVVLDADNGYVKYLD
jgi:muramoyltetrapeptide carboxypeptidase